MSWTKINPKIKAAFIGAVAAGLAAVVNAIYAVYPQNAFVNILYVSVPVVVGYLVKAE